MIESSNTKTIYKEVCTSFMGKSALLAELKQLGNIAEYLQYVAMLLLLNEMMRLSITSYPCHIYIVSLQVLEVSNTYFNHR